MKKIMLFATLSAAMILGSGGTAFAAVVFNTETEQYYSTDEDDGIICFSSLIQMEDDYRDTNMKCLENLVPTEENLSLEIAEAEASENVAEESSLVKVYQFVPENDFVVFSLNNHGLEGDYVYHVDVTNSETGEVIAKGTNISINKVYKAIKVTSDVAIQIEITSDFALLEGTEFQLGSTDSKQAESNTEVDEIISTPRASVETGLVPKNIDGTQGKIMESYTMETTGHKRLRTRFMESTNGMKTVNMAYEIDGENLTADKRYNIPLKDSLGLLSVASFGNGYVIDVRMSTNSTSGKATLNFGETV